MTTPAQNLIAVTSLLGLGLLLTALLLSLLLPSKFAQLSRSGRAAGTASCGPPGSRGPSLSCHPHVISQELHHGPMPTIKMVGQTTQPMNVIGLGSMKTLPLCMEKHAFCSQNTSDTRSVTKEKTEGQALLALLTTHQSWCISGSGLHNWHFDVSKDGTEPEYGEVPHTL